MSRLEYRKIQILLRQNEITMEMLVTDNDEDRTKLLQENEWLQKEYADLVQEEKNSIVLGR